MAQYSLQEEPPSRRPLALSAFLCGRNGNGKWGNGKWAHLAWCVMSAQDVRLSDGQT